MSFCLMKSSPAIPAIPAELVEKEPAITSEVQEQQEPVEKAVSNKRNRTMNVKKPLERFS